MRPHAAATGKCHRARKGNDKSGANSKRVFHAGLPQSRNNAQPSNGVLYLNGFFSGAVALSVWGFPRTLSACKIVAFPHKGGMGILLPDVSEPGFVSAASASADSIAALQLKIYSSHFFEALIMLKGFATAAICVAILVTIDYEFWGHVQRPGAPDAKANGLLVRSLK